MPTQAICVDVVDGVLVQKLKFLKFSSLNTSISTYEVFLSTLQ